MPVSDKKADQPAQDPLIIRSRESKRRLTGPELLQRWTELGLIGYRTDITDPEAHSRRLREAVQRRADAQPG